MSSEAPEEILLPATNGEAAVETDEAECAGEDPMSAEAEEEEKDVFAEVVEGTAEEVPSTEQTKEQKTPVVPKKRKASEASPLETNEKCEKTEEAQEAPEAEPSTSRAAAAAKDDGVDENQCRVCTTTENLVSLFKTTDQRKTIAEMLMLLCPNISIAQKDFMPQFVCYPCFGKINLAIQLKAQCEKTESELRKKLSRHKNKVRRPVGYVVVDAPLESEESEEEPNDDVEFKVSEASAEEDDDDSSSSSSDDSDYSDKKRPARGRAARRKSSATPSSKSRRTKSADSNSASKAKKTKKAADGDITEKEVFRCDQCDQIFMRKISLVLHKRTHNTDKASFWCELCGKQFKIQGAYRTHLEKHKNETNGFACEKCDEVYVSNADLKRHLAEDHNEKGLVYTCVKCKRTFVSQSRLNKHIPRCPGTPKKKSEYDGFPVGQDLFKTVAPLTSTYWSDSFSD